MKNAANEESPPSTPRDCRLRVCCYGSSSSATPKPYLAEAEMLGRTLALRGHTCVNGAGSSGCMASMNDGVMAEDGHVIGVIHEMFVVDGSDWITEEGGAHSAFHAGTREILVAGGNDLQERKRLLVKGADALIVLPGGPGTWDELWEMVCARNLGFTDIPIVCVNVDGYYDPFRAMLDRAYGDRLIRKEPEEILHFEPDSASAVLWVESAAKASQKRKEGTIAEKENKPTYRRVDSRLVVDRPATRSGNGERISSIATALRRFFLSGPSMSWNGGILIEDDEFGWSRFTASAGQFVVTLAVGVAIGLSTASRPKTS